MVFGFGKKKSSEQPVEQSPEIIQFSEISKFLHGIESPQRSEAINRAKTIREEIISNMKDIHEIILHLERDDLKLDDVDKNLRTIATRGKNSVVSTIKRETSSSLSNVVKYEDIILVNSQTNQVLKRLGDTLGLNSRIIHIFARKYADNLKAEISKMANNRNLLQTTINKYEDFEESVKKVEETANNVTDLRTKILQNSQRISELDIEINSVKTLITKLDKDILDLKSKKEYDQFLEIKNKINLLSSESKEIKNKIDMQFSKIARPLSKYSYISSFEKPVRKIMEEMIREPHDIINAQNKNSIIEVLQAVEKSVRSGSVSVKDVEKSMEQIEETISRLDEFLALKETHSDKISKLEQDLVIFDLKLLEMNEVRLQKEKVNLVNLEANRSKLHTETNENNNLLTKLKSKLEVDIGSLSKTPITLKI